MNFSPVDLQVENYTEMPDLLLHPHHLQLLKRFLRQWTRCSSHPVVLSTSVAWSFDVVHNELLGYNCTRFTHNCHMWLLLEVYLGETVVPSPHENLQENNWNCYC